MFCTNCGKELPDGTKFCTKCGKPVRQPPTGQDAFPDLEGIAAQKQQEAISNLPPQGYHAPTRAADDVSSPIREQIAPPPQYDDLDGIPPEPKQKGKGAMIAVIVGIVVLAAVIIFALVKFVFLADKQEDSQSQSSSITSHVADEPDADLDKDDDADDHAKAPAGDAEPALDWKDYTGVWQAGAYLFELTIEDGELNVTMADGSKSYWDSTDLADEKDSADFDLGGMAVRIKQRGKDSLRIAVNGDRYQAERYSGSMPDYTPAPAPAAKAPASTPAPAPNAPAATAPAAVTGTDSGYLYYSSSTGTRTANSMVPSNSSLHFWPLDKYAISTADLDRLTREEIDIIRNEAYARYGYVFTTDKWNNFFSNYTWYVPDASFTDARFSKLEKTNIDTIVNYEKGKGWL